MSYLTVHPRLLVGELLDLYGGHSVVDTGANVSSHTPSIVLNANRNVLQSGCSFKHLPVSLINTVLQGVLCQGSRG